jgi:hypothetical protein
MINDPWDWTKQNQQQVVSQPQVSNVIAPLGGGSQEPTPAAPGKQSDPLEGALTSAAISKTVGGAETALTAGKAAYTAASAAPLAGATQAATGLLGSALPVGAGAGGAAATAGGLGASLGAGLTAGLAAAAPIALPALGMYAAYKAVKGGK